MDKEQQNKLREIADQLDIITGRWDSYERLIGLINIFQPGSLPDPGKALENFASAVDRGPMSLEEQRQACMDVVLRVGAYSCGVEIRSAR